ncbi:MAG: DedA family protein [Chloroflexota bacterium]
MLYLDFIEHYILSSLQKIYDVWGWVGVSALLVFENATSITPSEVILCLAGWMLLANHGEPEWMIFVAGFYTTIGSLLGASIAYWFARLGGRPLVERGLGLIRVNLDHVNRAEQLFHRWGPGLVLIGRLIPGIRTFINIPAGLARMPFPAFVTATAIGSYLWNTLLIGAGFILGHEWKMIHNAINHYFPYLIIFGLSAAVIYAIITRFFRRTASGY